MTKTKDMYKKDREDFAWLNEDSKTFLSRGYLMEGVTAEERIKQIAEHAEKMLGIEGFSDKFYQYMAKGWFSLSSPIWANYGTPKGSPISCFGSRIPDSVDGILSTVAEVGMMSKIGGGTSGYFGDIRPRGSVITNNGRSDGSFNFAKLFDATIDTISQGSSRRGMFAGYIDVEHGDIEEWLDIQLEGNPIQLIYYGVCVGNDWIEEMKAGDQRKRKIWAKILQNRTEIGIPYLFFKDNANLNKPDVYKDKNMTITHSNMCFTKDTIVAVADGRTGVTIEQLANMSKGLNRFHVYSSSLKKVDEYTYHWNKAEIKEAVAFKTGVKKVVTVVLEDGSEFRCTPDHLLATTNGMWIEANRSKGAELQSFTQPNTKRGLKVVDVIDKGEVECVYDLRVEDNHNFYILTSNDEDNGVLVHNCSEIALPDYYDESFVCCLMSMNALYFDEWKDTDAVQVATYFLDSVISEFIQKCKNTPYLDRAVKFAKKHRALGIGVLGYHSYLQSKMIPFDSFEAMAENKAIFKTIQEKAWEASKELAELFGEPKVLKGYGRRNTTLTSVAPTKSSSFILGSVSPSVEPLKSNYYVKDLAKIKVAYKNYFLEKLLESKGLNNDAIWDSIMQHNGSVQHLTKELTDHERAVFKTFEETNQLAIIQQAGQRQKWIDQAQSINLAIHPDTPTRDVNALYLQAIDLGLKSLYYQFSVSAAQRFNRDLLVCSSCEA